ncbi:MAG: FapA family protein, partial [Candidatus Wallbacteria bacterium]|nr:FapA family protein [Candidatus Wallbacteria bacterium]
MKDKLQGLIKQTARHLQSLSIEEQKILSEVDGMPVPTDNRPVTLEDLENLKDDLLSTDASFTVTVSRDEYSACLSIIPAEGRGKVLTFADISERLRQLSIVYGIDHESIIKAVNDAASGMAVADVIIARGVARTENQPPIFRETCSRENRQRAGERVDYREQHMRSIVEKDTVFLEITPARPGNDGTTVKGAIVPATTASMPEINFGDNVRASEQEGLILVTALVSGMADIRDFFVNVEPVLNIDNNVDLSTGNIEFPGRVMIKGSVLDDFTVNAGGGIEVKKNVYAGVLTAKGSIMVGNGILGRNKGTVTSDSGISADFMENAVINCLGDIEVREAIIQSRVCTQGSVILDSGRGTIIGGKIMAFRSIRCKVLGSELGVKTI